MIDHIETQVSKMMMGTLSLFLEMMMMVIVMMVMLVVMMNPRW